MTRFCCRRDVGKEAKRLASFASHRVRQVQQRLQEEANLIAREVAESGFSSDVTPLHQQCVLDFDRADYIIGTRCFEAGAAAERDDIENQRRVFAECFSRQCGDSDLVTFVASALASQLAMSHLGSVCYAGPHSYAVPSGFTEPRYWVRHVDNCVELTLERVSQGFDQWASPGDEPWDCHKDSSMRQHVTIRLREIAAAVNQEDDAPRRLSADAFEVEVLDCWESIKLLWPDGVAVVKDGLRLDFRSPPEGCGSSPSQMASMYTRFLRPFSTIASCFTYIVMIVFTGVSKAVGCGAVVGRLPSCGQDASTPRKKE